MKSRYLFVLAAVLSLGCTNEDTGTIQLGASPPPPEPKDACTADSDCKKGKPICDTLVSLCVGCLEDDDCSDEKKPVCSARTRSCVECRTASDCVDPKKPACNVMDGKCVECLTSADCASDAGPLACDSHHHCEPPSPDSGGSEPPAPGPALSDAGTAEPRAPAP